LSLSSSAAVIKYGNASLVYYNQQRYQEAIKLYQQALQTEIEQVDCNYMIGMLK
jgi:tetratricopeptide (TPR) repeat protein